MPSPSYETGTPVMDLEQAETIHIDVPTITAPAKHASASRRPRHAARSNNPYTTPWARHYDRLLSMPPVGKIRRSEEHTLAGIFATTLKPTDHVLEIGPGTGRYTVDFARRVAHVTAVEQSAEMVALLHRRLQREGVTNCTVLEGDFAQARFDCNFDVVALIGVMDYVYDPPAFLEQAAAMAERALIFTTPHCGVLAKMHRTCNRMRGITVWNYTPLQVRSYLDGFDVEIKETGRCTRVCRGLTLACRAIRR